MKKTIILTAFLLVSIVSSTLANIKEPVSKRIQDAFNNEFVGASEVKWESSKTFVKATFKLNDQVMFAFYTYNGDLLGVTRNLPSSQLPINLLSDLKKQYGHYWISDLFEMTTSVETTYYLTLEDADYTLVLRSNGADGWYTFRKEKK